MQVEKDHFSQPGNSAGGILKVLEAYQRHGYRLLLGTPDRLVTKLGRGGRIIEASAGLSLSDILVFQWIAEITPWQRVLIIGNAFGFSTFVLASLCPGCYVDAIDAETEGSENRLGSALTYKIASEDFPGVSLTIGFSPQDLPKACRFNEYDTILIDGYHTNKQLIADFGGVRKLCAENGVVYCHDVGIARMRSGWWHIKTELLEVGDEAFDLHFTSSGSTIVVRGNPDLKELMRVCCQKLEDVYYYFGSRHVGLRSAIHMVFRTFRYSTRYGRYMGRPRLFSLRNWISEQKIPTGPNENRL